MINFALEVNRFDRQSHDEQHTMNQQYHNEQSQSEAFNDNESNYNVMANVEQDFEGQRWSKNWEKDLRCIRCLKK